MDSKRRDALYKEALELLENGLSKGYKTIRNLSADEKSRLFYLLTDYLKESSKEIDGDLKVHRIEI